MRKVKTRKTEPGVLIIVSAPSGCGKSTVVHRLMEKRENLRFSVRCNNEYGLFRPVLIPCILMNVSYMMDSSTYCIKKCCASSYIVLLICHLLNTAGCEDRRAA